MLDDSDFERFGPINVNIADSGDIYLFVVNDDLTLETDDRVQLIFTPTNTDIIHSLESAGEYVRDSAIVNIIDNDCKCSIVDH